MYEIIGPTIIVNEGFPEWLSGRVCLPTQGTQAQPWVRKTPWRRAWQAAVDGVCQIRLRHTHALDRKLGSP